MNYKEKASEIIYESIKSVIFIDEKAVEFYTNKPDEKILEEGLSKSLYLNFKEIGASLEVNRFDVNRINDKSYINYITGKRDLVLLDWKLAEKEGQDYSLKILSQIINSNHLHFCSIYTSESNYDEILNNIQSYFSGKKKEYYDNIKEELSPYEDVLVNIISKITFDPKQNGKLYRELIAVDEELPKAIQDITKIERLACALISVKVAFSNLEKSDREELIPSFIDYDNYSVNINNTIITIINKDENSANKIIEKIVEKVVASPNNFMELLGLDMQNNFSKNSSFIDSNLLDLSFNTLLFHRKQMLEKVSEEEFKNFITSLLIEHSRETLLKEDLKILDKEFLTSESDNIEDATNEDLAKLNTFYNGSIIRGKNKLNFGDIFFDEESNDYYLCITPLCDCLHEDNINSNFFFVKGQLIKDLTNLINSEDSWFKSYISHNKGILWAKEVDYIKPIQINVSRSIFIEDKIKINLIVDNNLKPVDLNYKFSLKNSYTQRIANHAFNHSIRVGVDFVKK
jgi:hypothetical protein